MFKAFTGNVTKYWSLGLPTRGVVVVVVRVVVGVIAIVESHCGGSCNIMNADLVVAVAAVTAMKALWKMQLLEQEEQ